MEGVALIQEVRSLLLYHFADSQNSQVKSHVSLYFTPVGMENDWPVADEKVAVNNFSELRWKT